MKRIAVSRRSVLPIYKSVCSMNNEIFLSENETRRAKRRSNLAAVRLESGRTCGKEKRGRGGRRRVFLNHGRALLTPPSRGQSSTRTLRFSQKFPLRLFTVSDRNLRSREKHGGKRGKAAERRKNKEERKKERKRDATKEIGVMPIPLFHSLEILSYS